MGKPTANRQRIIVLMPQNQNQPAPSCWRNNLADAAASKRGHGVSPRESHNSSNNGTTMSGQLSSNAPNVSKLLLNRTQISAGKTFTCKIAGTAKLFRARTKVSTAAWARALLATGSSRARTSVHPATSGSLSNCAAASFCQALPTSSNVIGQVSRLKIQTVPPNEIIFNGSQSLHTPV